MFLADHTIDDQGNVRTVGGAQDARLYYIDLEGNRKKYLLDGEGGITGSYVSTINGMSGEVTLTTSNLQNDSGFITSVNIPVSSVNGKTGNVLLDVHDIKYETVSGLMLSSYTYYTVSGVLTGDIIYSIPSGLHDTMVKFTTGPSATFTFSTPLTMQLNKEFNFEDEKTYVLAVDNGIIFWNELTAELSGTPLPTYVFEITGADVADVNGRYRRADTYDETGTAETIYYVNENNIYSIQYMYPDGFFVKNGETDFDSYCLMDFNMYYAEPWNCMVSSLGEHEQEVTIPTITPIE